MDAFLPPPWRTVISFAEIDSTQLEASRRLAAGEDLRGVVIRAGRQLAGRGRLDHAWVSSPGGLYVTAALPYDLALRPSDVGWVALIAAQAAAETLRQDWEFEAQIKWPNDLIVHGHKIAGILGEVKTIPENGTGAPARASHKSHSSHSSHNSHSPHTPARQILIGLGLNWTNRIAPGHLSAADLASATAPPGSLVDFRPGLAASGRDAFLFGWLERLNGWHEHLCRDYSMGLGMLTRAVETLLWRRGERITLKNTECGPVQGRLLGLGPGAAACIETGPDAILEVHCGWQIE